MKNFYWGGSGLLLLKQVSHLLKSKNNRSRTLFSFALPLLFFLFSNQASAQEPRQDSGADGQFGQKESQVGKMLPGQFWDLQLDMINDPKGLDKVTLGDFRDKKIIILDFWATWCGACIGMFPKMEELKKQFPNDLNVVPITFETRDVVEKFIKGWSVSYSDKEPIVSLLGVDKLLEYFPHRSLPHYVWLDSDGHFLGTSDPSQVNRENIEMAITGKLDLIQKVDVKKPYDRDELMMSAVNGISDENILTYTVFGRYEKNLRSFIASRSMGDDNEYSRLTFNNVSVITLAKYAYSRNDLFFADNRMNVIVKDSTLHNFPEDIKKQEVWQEKYCYTYEIVGMESREELKKQMQRDLKRLFPRYKIYTAVETRECWVLKKTRNTPLVTKGGAYVNEVNANGVTLQNAPVFDFFYPLYRKNFSKSKLPVIYDLDTEEKIDLKIRCNMYNMESINKALQEYGLAFVKEVRPVEMLFVTDSIENEEE